VRSDQALSGGQDRHGDSSWDPVWEAATHIGDDGWSVEARIPLSQLRFRNAEEQVWGVRFTREIARNRENAILSFTPKDERSGLARYGDLLGLRGIHQSRGLEILPYFLGRADFVPVDQSDEVSFGNPYRDGSDFLYGSSFDLEYRLSSNLTLDGTVNPDFGQVEVDPAVVNLYSRRIGASPKGGLPDEALAGDLRSSAHVGGLDFLHEFANRTWSLNGHFVASRIAGDPEAATALAGYKASLELQKQAGLHWEGGEELGMTSPGFEVNDRLGTGLNFRGNGTFVNYWSANLGVSHDFAALDDRLTRGGPLARKIGGNCLSFGSGVGIKPSRSWEISLGPRGGVRRLRHGLQPGVAEGHGGAAPGVAARLHPLPGVAAEPLRLPGGGAL